jgi:hypothetical protein
MFIGFGRLAVKIAKPLLPEARSRVALMRPNIRLTAPRRQRPPLAIDPRNSALLGCSVEMEYSDLSYYCAFIEQHDTARRQSLTRWHEPR